MHMLFLGKDYRPRFGAFVQAINAGHSMDESLPGRLSGKSSADVEKRSASVFTWAAAGCSERCTM